MEFPGFRDCKLHEIPECAAVMQFLQMAQFMHDDVVAEFGRQVEDAIVEVEILARRAASPSRTGVADGQAFVLHGGAECRIDLGISRREMPETFNGEHSRSFLASEVVLAAR